MEGFTMGTYGPRGSGGKKALRRQIFDVGYLPNCGQKEPACSTVFDWARSVARGTATVQAAASYRRRTPLQNGSARIFGSLRVNGRDMHGNILSFRKVTPVQDMKVYVGVEV